MVSESRMRCPHFVTETEAQVASRPLPHCILSLVWPVEKLCAGITSLSSREGAHAFRRVLCKINIH
jgi:hypothetical protein